MNDRLQARLELILDDIKKQYPHFNMDTYNNLITNHLQPMAKKSNIDFEEYMKVLLLLDDPSFDFKSPYKIKQLHQILSIYKELNK